MSRAGTRLGLVADTHDLLRPELIEALAGVDAILHAGDVCSPEIIDALADLAPVAAVRGNNDRGDWADALPEALVRDIEGVRIWMLHARQDLRRLPPPAGTDIVVVGHSHRPEDRMLEPDGPRLVNPGSAGRRRFRLPVTCALMDVVGERAELHLQELMPLPPPRASRRERKAAG